MKTAVKKVVYIRKVYEEIERNENQCSIRAFPESIILFESRDRESFLIRDIDQMSQEQFVLCAFHDCYELKDGEVNRLHTFVSMETAIMSDLGLSFSLAQGQVLKAKKCTSLCTDERSAPFHGNCGQDAGSLPVHGAVNVRMCVMYGRSR